MSHYNIISSAGIILILLPGIASSEPIVKISQKYYSVSGANIAEIRRSLNYRSPIIDKGQKYDARTLWYIKARWKYRVNRQNGMCVMTGIQTFLDVKYTMPKLVNIRITTKNVLQRWRFYVRALFRHEQGHKEYGVRAANEIEIRIMTLPASRNCQVLSSNANRVIRSVMKKYKYLEREYDRVTNHGMNKGARFP